MSVVSKNSGFTLIEIQVSLVILLLLFGLMVGGLHLSGKTWQSAEKVANQAADLRTISSLLARQMNGLMPLVWFDKQGPKLLFAGRNDELTYTGSLPVHAVVGGPWLLRLYTNNQQELRLDYRVIDTAHHPLQDVHADWHSIRLLDGVEEFSIRYLTPVKKNRDGQWQSDWHEKKLPSAVSFSLRVAGRDWPELSLPVPVHRAQGLPYYIQGTGFSNPPGEADQSAPDSNEQIE